MISRGGVPGLPWRRPVVGLSLFALIAISFLLAVSSGSAAPAVTTDKADYYSNETAIITGTGFAPGASYDIPVIRPNGSIVKGDGSFTPGWDTVAANGSGGFTYSYKLDGIQGTYEVRVYPSPWNGNTSKAPITSVTFKDADIDFTQCRNDSDNNNVKDDCDWVNGAIN